MMIDNHHIALLLHQNCYNLHEKFISDWIWVQLSSDMNEAYYRKNKKIIRQLIKIVAPLKVHFFFE